MVMRIYFGHNEATGAILVHQNKMVATFFIPILWGLNSFLLEIFLPLFQEIWIAADQMNETDM